eukprot:CAMPEP_0201552036 /NCGR_PEP_ID=MMETSP0173_2-20130828/12381_1 /ASSEMBLY_ACC=CAM_ASM_000268 /TAXON_ID=218659 /ORGANISM="Vexillifera sp., Strain DIVA3 564/2" /LENGTH=568 /DNA_ID=CAMNT_0047962431 /DNA_START=1 /DNA_END=1708 /DNA_ORIENTATION=+
MKSKFLILVCLIYLTASSIIDASFDRSETEFHQDRQYFFRQYREGAEPQWLLRKDLEVDHTARSDLTLALRPRNLDRLNQALYAVSDPRSPQYGQHWSREEIAALVGLSQSQLNVVYSWLASYDINRDQTELHPLGDALRILDLSIGQIESLVQAKFGVYEHVVTGERCVRPSSGYSLPAGALSDVVDFVQGLHSFPISGAPIVHYSNLQERADYAEVTPSFLRKTYGIPQPLKSQPGISQSTLQFAPNFYSDQDLQTFFSRFDPQSEGQKITQVYGDTRGSTNSIESNLDVQYITSIGSFVNTTIYYVDAGQNIEDAFLEWAQQVNSQNNPSQVISISYGQYGGQYSNKTVQRLDVELQKMGLRGISVTLASGDNGVGCSFECRKFLFDFPSSPHLTMVGATQFSASSGKESGATLSSGGFSEDYFRPVWQNTAVLQYLGNSSNDLPPSSMFYRDGRGYPDVSAPGQNVRIVDDGRTESVGGTSCSSPIFAGMISLINSERAKQGKGTLGWLNPFIYANEDAFTDITEGNNKNVDFLVVVKVLTVDISGTQLPEWVAQFIQNFFKLH